MATKAQLAKAAAELKKTQAALAKATKTSAPTSGVIPGFKPAVTMPTPAKQPGQPGFVGPTAIAETQFIFNTLGEPVEIYTTGPKAGTSVETGFVVFQGPGPTRTTGTGSTTTTTTPAKPAGSEKYAGLVALLSSYGIDKIADMVDKILTDFPEADGEEVLNLLRYDARYNKPYMDRFAGNAQRLKSQLPLLDEATYLQQERGYSKVFKAYGLTNLDNTEQYTKLIGLDVSVDEATTRISLAYDRVLKADPKTLEAFRKFYPTLGPTDLVSAMLDPEQQLPALERKVQAAEIGGAALRQGLSAELMGTSTKTVGAQALEAAGVSTATAVKGYATIAQELPTMEKLSSIYGSTLDQYGQKEAEQADLLGLASARRKKASLVAVEEAQFQGSAGTIRGSLAKPSQGYF
jgi:hypothetical protein